MPHHTPRAHTPAGSLARLGPLAAVLLVLAACDCGGDEPLEPIDPTVCETDEDCVDAFDDRYTCENNRCERGPRYCDAGDDAACCPGQRCGRVGFCMDEYEACGEDDDCAVAGQRCLASGDGCGLEPAHCPVAEVESGSSICTFPRCDDGGACPDGLHCFAGVCAGEDPCGGACPDGQACVVANNTCHPAPQCDLDCPPGHLATFVDPDNVFDDCSLDLLACACEPLLPLVTRDLGRHSDLAVLPDESVAVSAFAGDTGDLVVIRASTDGEDRTVDWVDGVPEGAEPGADPDGPRGGITDPGPEVGRYTSIAVDDAGDLHVSYYDADDGRLKYARGIGDDWQVHVVDEAGDVGRHTSLAIDGSGRPVVAYAQLEDADGDPVTALKVAHATGSAPRSDHDWDIVTVDVHAAEVDEDEWLGPFPEATGLTPHLLVSGGAGPAVAFYDRAAESLKLALGVDATSGSPGTVVTVDGGPGDRAGSHPALASLGGGELLVVYHADGRGELRWATVASNGEVLDRGLVDAGIETVGGGGAHRVGADASVHVDGDGRWIVIYQDATAGALKVAIRDTGGDWTRVTLDDAGAAGFWANTAWRDGQVFVSHAVLEGRRRAPMGSTVRIERFRP